MRETKGNEIGRDNALDGTADRLRWMEHFRKFEGLNELDRRTVINLIKSIRIICKTEFEITFNYQDEYKAALGLRDLILVFPTSS